MMMKFWKAAIWSNFSAHRPATRPRAPISVAPATTQFLEFSPAEGKAPRFRTEFKVAYDDRSLYVFVRAFDPHPDSIMTALTRRDVRGPSDQLKVMIDSYHDRRSGFEFAVNPVGVKRDYAMYNDMDEDGSWDGVWDVATHVDSLGWTAEFRIPFSQLRYANMQEHVFGFAVWRDIERFKERTSWPLYRPTQGGVSSQLGLLQGVRDITPFHRLEVVPYGVAKSVSVPHDGAPWERSRADALPTTRAVCVGLGGALASTRRRPGQCARRALLGAMRLCRGAHAARSGHGQAGERSAGHGQAAGWRHARRIPVAGAARPTRVLSACAIIGS